jgi:ParB family transcriptional regulator, chromosome partitioning protein
MAKKLVLANNPLLSGPGFGERERSGVPYREVPLVNIDRDINQPRVNFDEEKLAELAQSIKTYGVLSPILVRPGKSPGRYNLIAGERRLRAAKAAGLTVVPAIVSSTEDGAGEKTLGMQLVENLQRADLTPLERAHAIGALKEAHGLSVREVADRIGVSKSMVQRSLDILDLPDDLLNALREGAPESKILMLAKISEPEVRAGYLKDLEGLTRSQLKQDMQGDEGRGGSRGNKRVSAPEDVRIADEIQRALGLRVILVRSSTDSVKGKLTVEFYSDDDLQELFRKLVAEG